MFYQIAQLPICTEDAGVVGKKTKKQACQKQFKFAAPKICAQQGFVQLGHRICRLSIDCREES